MSYVLSTRVWSVRCTDMSMVAQDKQLEGMRVRVRGIVQGVGFRPTVWRLARDLGLRGTVCNDSQGVLIEIWGVELEEFIRRLRQDPPPLARIDSIESLVLEPAGAQYKDFSIVDSGTGIVDTDISPDSATCPECLTEVMDPSNRRFRYAFTNCTHCGPRLSIVRRIPYDRQHTSMAAFKMCPACQKEYDDPTDRRFHAQPNACPVCGPKLWLEDRVGQRVDLRDDEDPIEAAQRLIGQGAIVAIKGLGGIHLACDACNPDAVETLRQRKQRYHKPLALMAADVAMVERFAVVDETTRALLNDRSAPIVVVEARGDCVAPAVTPNQNRLGFMLPYTPLHHLLMHGINNPIVLTSGNHSDEPQCIDNDEARTRLGDIADYFLLHDRDIVNRLDDSVVQTVAGAPRLMRRARGYAPASLPLPAGFEDCPPVLAMGGELKNTFCLAGGSKAVLSQHIGDLQQAATVEDYLVNLSLYRSLFAHNPEIVVVDRHPDYFSTQTGQRIATEESLPLLRVQHHHAHIAAVLAEHGRPRDSAAVLGIALDGLGMGDDGLLWGGEFLVADYSRYRRIARFDPVPMIGGAQAIREPWRNTYAHLTSALGWESVRDMYGDSPIVQYLERKPLGALATMVSQELNSPLASSCGRLFDAVAAAIGVCRDRVSFEGQAAMELETLATPYFAAERGRAYACARREDGDVTTLGWAPLWRSLLEDLGNGVASGVIAARFHQGLVESIVSHATRCCNDFVLDTVALGGGVFQNRLLLEGVCVALTGAGLNVLVPRRVPVNDGGLALGQAVIAASDTYYKDHQPPAG
jgi:hydrogenase maturation protein HypF